MGEKEFRPNEITPDVRRSDVIVSCELVTLALKVGGPACNAECVFNVGRCPVINNEKLFPKSSKLVLDEAYERHPEPLFVETEQPEPSYFYVNNLQILESIE